MAVAICARCGHRHPFRRQPLFIVTGASGTGKTTIGLELVAALPEWIGLDSDILWGKAFENLECTAADPHPYRTIWLRMAKNIGQSGRPVVLLGSLDALGDTWLGVVRWDPTKCTLAYHVVRTIEGRADKHRKHAMQRPHDVIDDTTDASRSAERDASERCSDSEEQIARVRASETMARIRVQAAKDLPVLRILDGYDHGCTTKDEVLAHARMKSRTYHNAYGRLRRIVRSLTDNALVARARA